MCRHISANIAQWVILSAQKASTHCSSPLFQYYCTVKMFPHYVVYANGVFFLPALAYFPARNTSNLILTHILPSFHHRTKKKKMTLHNPKHAVRKKVPAFQEEGTPSAPRQLFPRRLFFKNEGW